MKSKTGLVTSLALAAATLASAHFAAADNTYYRWLDDRGNLVHSDRPPPSGTSYEVVSTGSSFKRVVEANEGAVPAEVKPRAGNEFSQVDTTAAREAAEKNPEYCKQARDNLRTLETAPRVRVRDEETGEFRYLTEEQKAAEIAKAEQGIGRWC